MGQGICPMYGLVRQMGNLLLSNTSFNDKNKVCLLLLSNQKHWKSNVKNYKIPVKYLIIFRYYKDQKVIFGKL